MSRRPKRSNKAGRSKGAEESRKDEKPEKRGLVAYGLLAVASAFLVWLSFPPADLGFLMWVALIPWLVMIARTSAGRAALLSGAAGYGLFFALLHWIRFVTLPGWFALAFYCALYWILAALLLSWFHKRNAPFIVVAPLVLTALEFIRANLLTGFPLFLIGHTQYEYLPLIQVADLAGVYGITFVLALVNGCAADIVTGRWRGRGRYVAATVAAVLIVACIGYGLARRDAGDESKGARVCLVQGNVPISLKLTHSAQDILEPYGILTQKAIGQEMDLLIWPETMFPVPVYREDAKLVLSHLARGANAHLLIGAETRIGEPAQRFNSAYFISPEGEIIDRYDKIHLVVFGEYTPLKGVFPFLKAFRPPIMGMDLTPGDEYRIFTLPTRRGRRLRFGVTICYEDLVAGLFREFCRGGVDLMVNITNDGWFRDSSELDAHLAACVFRAVENRVPIARCANTGISAIIAPDGRITHKLVDPYGKCREVEGILIGTVTPSGQMSIYTHCGDVFAWLCLAGTILMAGAMLMNRPRHRAVPEP